MQPTASDTGSCAPVVAVTAKDIIREHRQWFRTATSEQLTLHHTTSMAQQLLTWTILSLYLERGSQCRPGSALHNLETSALEQDGQNMRIQEVNAVNFTKIPFRQEHNGVIPGTEVQVEF